MCVCVYVCMYACFVVTCVCVCAYVCQGNGEDKSFIKLHNTCGVSHDKVILIIYDP